MPVDVGSGFWERCWARQQGASGRVKGAILAAGLGKRMDPLTVSHLPKPMFPLGGKSPMVELWVRRFVESGITDVSMNLCVLSDTIRRHFGDGSKFVSEIRYVDEPTPTGTLGGVCKQALGSQAKTVLPDEVPLPFREFGGSTLIVPSGDIVTNFGAELLEEAYDIHRKAGAAFTMVLVPIPWERRCDFGTAIIGRAEERKGLVSSAGRIVEFREKDPESPSNLNNASIYVIEMDLIKTLDTFRTAADFSLPHAFYDFGRHVFPAMLGQIPYAPLSKNFELFGIQYNGSWFDVGQKRDYLRVNESLLDGKINVVLPYEKFPWGYLGSHTKIDFSKVRIVPPVIIGDNCVVEAGATLGPYAVIGDDWIIERDANIRHSVLWGRYPFYSPSGREISVVERQLVDRHQVRKGAVVEECIVVGGTIEGRLREKTVDVLENGELSVLSIDYAPTGPRA